MSNKKTPEARLLPRGHGPYYEGLERVQQLLYGGDPSRVNEVFTSHVRHRLPKHGPKGVKRQVVTSDGYQWMMDIAFSMHGNHRFHILLPWTRDNDSGDGTRSDRHMAVYYRGRPLDEMQLIVAILTIEEQIIAEYENMYVGVMTDREKALIDEYYGRNGR